MNEFDSLFEKKPMKYNRVEKNGLDDFNSMINHQKRNALLLLIYILANIILPYVFLLQFQIKYSDQEDILTHISTISDPQILLDYDDENNANFPNEANFNMVLINNSGIKLPTLTVNLELFDASNSVIETFRFNTEGLDSGHIYEINETITIDNEPADYQVTYNLSMDSWTQILLMFSESLIVAALFLIIDRNSFKEDFRKTKYKIKETIGYILTGTVAIYIAMILSTLIFEVFKIVESSENEETIRSFLSKDFKVLILMFFTLCVLTPIVEEVIFRKVTYNFLEKKLGKIVAIIGSGLIFGLMHVIMYGDFVQSIPYILMGIILGYMYYLSKKNLFVTISIHFINNFISFLMYILIIFGINII